MTLDIIKQQFKQAQTIVNSQGIDKSVIAASSFRSGSSMICEILSRNGFPGLEKEKFQDFHIFRNAQNFTEFQDRIYNIFSSANKGVFCSKMMWPHRNDLAESLGCPRENSERLLEIFPNCIWIHIIRRDKFAQAVSFYRAKQTNRWHVYDDSSEPTLEYDFEKIRSALIEIITHDHLWKDFFQKIGVDPINIYYEDFESDTQLAAEQLYQRIQGVFSESSEFIANSNLKKQRDEVSRVLYRKFLEDFYRTGF